MSEKKTIIKNNNYSDTYRRRRIPIGFCAAGEDGEDIDIAKIFVDRHGTIEEIDNSSIRKLLDTICRVYICCRDEETGQLREAITRAGLDPKDLKTTRFNINSEYEGYRDDVVWEIA